MRTAPEFNEGYLAVRHDHDRTVVIKTATTERRKDLRELALKYCWTDAGTGGAPGREFMRQVKLLRAYRADNCWVGVFECAAYYDV